MNPQDEALSVTQADIDAYREMMVTWTEETGPQFFARHRLSHSTPGDAEVREAVKRSRDTAMEYAVKARIPECGKFGEIAQDLDAALSSLATPSGRAQGEVSGWLIEHSEAVEWLTLRPGEASYQVCWTKESNEALRFCRRQDAEDYVSAHFGGDGPFLITEHQWVAAPPAQDQTKGDEA